MWFIKTLTLQYMFFYVYAYTRQRSERHKTLILVLLSIVSFLISYMVELRHAISLPLFYMGVWIADHSKQTRQICCRFIIPCLLIFSLLAVCYMGRHNPMILHVFFNYIVVIMSITILSLLKVSITNLPSVIGQSSFDVYLVHNKVLMSMRYLWGIFPLWSFIIASFIATAIFGYFRFTMSKVLRCKK